MNDNIKSVISFYTLCNKLKDTIRKGPQIWNANRKRISSSITVALVMLAISLIEIILMTRSSFLSRIKEVGTLRAIGVKKSDIYKMFMGEAFAITTLTQIPGVLFMSYCIITRFNAFSFTIN